MRDVSAFRVEAGCGAVLCCGASRGPASDAYSFGGVCGEQDCCDRLGGERCGEFVCGVARCAGGTALHLEFYGVFFQRVVRVRYEGLADDSCKRECLELGGCVKVRKLQLNVLRVFFGAVHEDDGKGISFVCNGTVGGNERVVGGYGFDAVRVSVAAE